MEKSISCDETCACTAGLAVGPGGMADRSWKDRADLTTPSFFFFLFLEERGGSHIACITDEEGRLKLVSLSVCARSVGFYGRLDTT